MGKALALAALLALMACTTAKGSYCEIARPMRPSAEEIAAMTDARVAEVLAHNEKGRKLCGWTR
jgi:hypothetical protein